MKDEFLEENTRILLAKAAALGPETNKPVYCRGRSSLHQIINTKKKADDFMRQIKYLEEQSRAKEKALHP